MKRNHIYIIGFIAVLGFFSCSKERGPSLTVFVHEVGGAPAVGAEVHVWPGGGQQNGGSGIDDSSVDQIGVTDATGNVSFSFENSVVLDIDVIFYKSGVDSLLNPIIDTLRGFKVTKIEAIRQRSEDNNYNESIDIK